MHKLSDSIDIHVPVNQVFDFIFDPMKLQSVWPSMIEVSNIKDLPKGGREYDFLYKMAGVRLNGHSTTAKFQANKYLEATTSGGVISTFRWYFEQKGDHTHLRLDVEYSIPVPVVGVLAEAVVQRMNERELTNLLANIRGAVETALVAGQKGTAVIPEKRI